MRIPLILIILLIGIHITHAAVNVSNPIIWSDVPDVDVIRVGDTYYMVSTTMYFTPGVPIMKSKDLVSWEMCTYVYETLATGNKQTLSAGEHEYSRGQWATSLRYNDGTFYVFFMSYTTGKSYIFQTRDIENGTWTKYELNGTYHDAGLFFDDDGKKYLVWGSGDIKIRELNADVTGFAQGSSERTLFKAAYEGLHEGAHIHKINGYYYVFTIAWPSGFPRVVLTYRSNTLLGNYENRMSLNSGVGSYTAGVAQGGVVDTPEGKWYGMFFQDHGSVGRIPVLVPVTWQDNWPVMGVNGKAPITLNMDGDDYRETFMAKSDEFNYSANKLDMLWQWNHNPDNTAWSVTERPGYLRLTNKTMTTNLLNARNTLTMRTEGPACTSSVKLDVSNMKVGDYAGLSAFQLKYGNVGVYVADNGTKKIYMAENANPTGEVQQSANKIIAEQNLTGNDVYLRVIFYFSDVTNDGSASNNRDKANFYYSTNGNSWTKIGSELSMSYDLKLFTGYRSALYSYATKNTGGYADFDFFKYSRADWNTPVITTSSSSSITTVSSSSTIVEECNEYIADFCGGRVLYADILSGSDAMPTEGQCLFIKDFTAIQPNLNSTVSINGVENTCGEEWGEFEGGCMFNTKPASKNGGYYVYVNSGSINTYDPEGYPNGWQGIEAGTKPSCEPTSIVRPMQVYNSGFSRYYSLKGEPLGINKPEKAGVYIVKQGSSVKKVVVR